MEDMCYETLRASMCGRCVKEANFIKFGNKRLINALSQLTNGTGQTQGAQNAMGARGGGHESCRGSAGLSMRLRQSVKIWCGCPALAVFTPRRAQLLRAVEQCAPVPSGRVGFFRLCQRKVRCW
jgi:hypothetical protein